MVANCLVALGANLPTSTRAPIEHLRYALEVLEGESVSLAALSLWYSTPAFPVGSGPDYVNAVAKFKTGLDAYELIELLSKTERKLGRIREDRWGARVCDLDSSHSGSRLCFDPFEGCGAELGPSRFRPNH